MNYFKRFFKFAAPYKKLWILSISLNILYALFTTLSFVVLMPTLNILFGETEKIYEKPVFKGFYESLNKEYLGDLLNYWVTYTNETFGAERTLLYVVFAVVTVFLLKNIFSYLGQLTMIFLKNSVLKDLRSTMYDKIISLPLPFFSEQKKGDIINRATGDVAIINETYLNLVITFIREPVNIIFSLIVMIKSSWQLSIFIFTFIPVAGFVISIISKRIKQQSSEIFEKSGGLLGIIEESISGLKIIKAFNGEGLFSKRFSDQSEEVRTLSNKMSTREALASPMSEFLGIATIAALLWYGGKMVLIDKTMVGSTFTGFILMAYNVLTPAKAMAKANNNIKIGNAAAQRIFEILDTKNNLEDKKDSIELKDFNSEIEFKDISFKYGENYVLENFSLKIPKGKTVALVGQSGSGKSTLSNLITRFYDVNEGGIYIDGHNIKDVTKKSLRSLMGVVTQSPTLFNDTASNNIALSNPDAQIEDIQNAAEVANAHEFLKDLDHKYNTYVGDRGGSLSGGQQQRVAIARAVLKSPPIMILDEATSALDTESEKLVQDALENMMKNRTSLVIAHRLSTIQNADLIVVMRKGKIIEQGKHEELLKTKGEYHKLVTMQSLE
ncbi:ATP-binding cassette, subfamily B, MsbA [Tenacibaculum sp. MAR_2009_124]|uniref:ABC transporter ATP-binding protein n=1 Tax=Tenacibaculum sp. MAR_2009_124 TaxID=1250059 RepID=UPI00089ADFF8|nr:ABC transporter ATP-binding protein [Tenacibaculum sp. MAR_2009_124]SEB42772.1 ATP-binding cassette, subfamily B, MsbA [Tenacibaculum sp. MAR_2009_124]